MNTPNGDTMFKKNNVFIVIAALAGLVAQSAQAIVFRGEVWSKQRTDGTYQMVYCLDDIHVSTFITRRSKLGYTKSEALKVVDGLDTIAQKQKAVLYNRLSMFPKNKITVLVEDMHSDSHGHATYLKELTQFDKQSMYRYEFLASMTQDCIHKDIPVINLECRQNKTSMWTYLNAQNNNVQAPLEPNVLKSPSDMQAESDAAIQEIKSHSISNDFLNRYNAQTIKQYEIKRKSVAQKDIYEDTCWMAIRADGPLLDLRAINHIYASLDKQQDIVLAMGADHIKNITKVLYALGYRIIDEKGCDSSFVDSMLPLSVEHKFNEARVFDIANFFDLEATRIIDQNMSKKWFLNTVKDEVQKNQSFVAAEKIAAREISNENVDVKRLALELFAALVKKDYAFETATQAAVKGMVEQSVQHSALNVFKQLNIKIPNETREAAQKILDDPNLNLIDDIKNNLSELLQ